MKKYPIRIAVTHASDPISYAFLFKLASGEVLGIDQPICLHLIGVEGEEKQLEGVAMEIDDCAFPLVHEIVATLDLKEGFRSVNWAVLVERARLDASDPKFLPTSAKIFWEHGKAIQEYASFDVNILTVGNPCNTNCWVARQSAPDIPDNRWGCLTCLNASRAKVLLAEKSNYPISKINHVGIWGNHSSSIYTDFFNIRVDQRLITDVVEKTWLEKDFIQGVCQRRAAMNELRGGKPAASAAHAIIENIRAWTTSDLDDWFSMGVVSDGSYGIEKGLVYAFPLQRQNSEWRITPNIRLSDFSKKKIDQNVVELQEELKIAKKALNLK